jgi:hypothetical protein
MGLKMPARIYPMMLMKEMTSVLCIQLKSTKLTDNRKNTLQITAMRERNKSQRMNNISANTVLNAACRFQYLYQL